MALYFTTISRCRHHNFQQTCPISTNSASFFYRKMVTLLNADKPHQIYHVNPPTNSIDHRDFIYKMPPKLTQSMHSISNIDLSNQRHSRQQIFLNCLFLSPLQSPHSFISQNQYLIAKAQPIFSSSTPMDFDPSTFKGPSSTTTFPLLLNASSKQQAPFDPPRHHFSPSNDKQLLSATTQLLFSTHKTRR